ncbi:rhombotarget lipoprotein [Thalassotalea ponticola]|uniref:rhombotarget lipoprotein n=1 Tax=Thalassotalea ponticola TaxID=1523392 RepID=UPI0025B4F0D4|nr:rhombotarget lipoprotein [Thalassotalea ponticola]MDN3652745.1 rhombotarget lipoprotein [Thalassotalea ponticola]
MGKQHLRASTLLLLVAVGALSACASKQTRHKSSVVDYLYPTSAEMAVEPTIPTLTLPLKVGIAFVPEQVSQYRGANMWSGVAGGGMLTEAEKSNLLEKVADNFRQYDFVSAIEVIPSAYLTPKGSFQNLEQIKTMYGTDVIALVSYDQVQFTDEGLLSLTYWTLVGAYVISGEKNDTSTMLDTAVYDIRSKALLFRAPGTSNIKGRSTPVNLSEELRSDSREGFEQAAQVMTQNLDNQLAKFKETLKADPSKANIVHKQGYSGSGSLNLTVLLLLFCVPFRSTLRTRLRG